MYHRCGLRRTRHEALFESVAAVRMDLVYIPVTGMKPNQQKSQVPRLQGLAYRNRIVFNTFKPIIDREVFVKVLILFFALIVTGCATTPPNPQPFQDFLEATSQVAQSADQAIALEYEQSLAAYENRFKTGEAEDISKLFLGVDPEHVFDANYEDEPVFIAIGEQRRQLGKLNQLVTEYAALLVRIVGSSGAYDVGEQAKALNKETGKLMANVKELTGGGTSERLSRLGKVDTSALLSTAFATAAKAYIENKRRKDLVELLNLGQPPMDVYADLGQVIARTAAASLKTHYSNRFLAVVRNNKKDVKAVLALNDSFLIQLKLLKELDGAFQTLPQEHARLTAAVAAGADVSFKSLIERAKSLKSLYEELAKANAAAAKG